MKQLYILLACALLVSSCSTSNISKDITRKYPPLDRNADVAVIELQQPIPQEAEQIGTVYVDDSGTSKNCSYDGLIEKIKREARKVGGNTIKIAQHIPPGTAGSACHKITAHILKAEFVPSRGITRENTTPGATPEAIFTPADTAEI